MKFLKTWLELTLVIILGCLIIGIALLLLFLANFSIWYLLLYLPMFSLLWAIMEYKMED